MLLVDYEGVIRLVNKQAEKLFGYSRNELIGQRIEMLVPARFADGHPDLRDGYAHLPVSRSLAAGQGLKSLRKDGSELSVAISLSPITTAEGPAVLTAVRDITEIVVAERSRREAQQALAESERQLRTLVRNVPGAIYRYSDNVGVAGVFEYMSDAIETISGYPPGHFIGQPSSVLMHIVLEADRHRLDEAILSAIPRGGAFQTEYRIHHRNGDKRWLSVQGTVTHDDVKDCRVVDGVMFDITDRMQAQDELREARAKAEQTNRSKSTFLANMSHELRTPLNAILGYSEMLMEEAEDLELADFTVDLRKIHQAGGNLLALINDVLDLSKIEAGKTEIFVDDIDVNELLEEVSATVGPLMTRNDNRFEVERGDNLGHAQQDSTKLRQSQLNLLSNAAKFTHQGTITLRVDREHSESGDSLVFEVRDTGIGIEADKLATLFDEFTQADASTTRRYGGTGLGLAICRRFCRLLGGEVEVRSTPGKGSVFSVRVPVELLEKRQPRVVVKESQAMPVEELEALRRQDAGSTVLVIDDDPEARDIVRRFLEQDGFQVVCAASGEEGLRLAHQLEPAAVTLDVMMPDMDGWTVLRAFKADPHLMRIPVLLLTMVDDKSKGYSLGANDYLTKPVDRNRLLHTLERYRSEAGHCSVLVVEDESDIARMMVRMLEKSGCSAKAVGNGREALEAISAEEPDLVLLDLMMPVMDGFEFLMQLRSQPRWRELPVIVVTAKELTEEDRLQLSGKVEEVLEKGAYTREQLIELVRGTTAEHS